MAVGAISRAAKGLYGFIDLITDGIGPRTTSQELVPQIDAFPFLGADSLRVVDNAAAWAVGAAEAQAVLTPPLGRTWIVRSVAGELLVPAQNNNFLFMLGLSNIQHAEGDTGLGLMPLAFSPARISSSGTAAGTQIFGLHYQFDPPIVLIGGGGPSIFALGNGVSPSPFGIEMTVVVMALVHDVPS